MALVIDLKAFEKAGVEATSGWTWDEYFDALRTNQDKLKIAGDTGYFNASKAEQAERYGSHFGNLILFQGHSRLDAYAAVRTGDGKLAKRAREKFYDSDGYKESAPWKTEKVSGPTALVAGVEAT